MDIQTHAQLLRTIEEEFVGKEAQILFTQWDTDDEDEEETGFSAKLLSVALSDNEFGEKDLHLVFDQDGEQAEILMELPKTEEDLADFENGRLSIYGTEAEIVLTK